MSFKFDCPYCGQHLTATTDQVGMVAPCPGCAESVTVPKRVVADVPPFPPPLPAALRVGVRPAVDVPVSEEPTAVTPDKEPFFLLIPWKASVAVVVLAMVNSILRPPNVFELVGMHNRGPLMILAEITGWTFFMVVVAFILSLVMAAIATLSGSRFVLALARGYSVVVLGLAMLSLLGMFMTRSALMARGTETRERIQKTGMEAQLKYQR